MLRAESYSEKKKSVTNNRGVVGYFLNETFSLALSYVKI